VTGIKAEEIKKLITPENVVCLLKELGSDRHITDRNGNLIFKTVCHGGNSYKLYYYIDSGTFTCYTGCGDTFDIFELVTKALGYNFPESLMYICRLFGFQTVTKGFNNPQKLTDDWELIEKYNFLSSKEEEVAKEMKEYDGNILDYFAKGLHESWLADGISHESANKFDIRYDNSNNRIIIPHRSIDGKLIGIRVRNLEERAIDIGMKYMPLILQKELYNHPLGANLYGIYENLSSIKKYGKIVLFESEKSVLQCETFYPNNNFSVATCGSSITNAQKSLILSLGIKEVFIAFDKEYQSAFSPESDVYADKIIKLAQKFAPYMTTYVLWDTEGLLNYKDSPSDKGKTILGKLMKSKFEIKCEE
jgi:hypothetical protein